MPDNADTLRVFHDLDKQKGSSVEPTFHYQLSKRILYFRTYDCDLFPSLPNSLTLWVRSLPVRHTCSSIAIYMLVIFLDYTLLLGE